MNIGEELIFGKYEWKVLRIIDGKALIITKYIIDHRSYNDVYEDTSWADCSLRRYLNNDFLNAFSIDEKARICLTVNENKDNSWYLTKGGDDTKDYVFLLSLEEATCLCFGDSSDKLFNHRKNQRYWFERKDENNEKRIAFLSNNHQQVWWWWLRTPGRVSVKAVYVHGDGNIGIQGNNILKGNIADGKCTGGVRPCLWIRL